MLQKQLNKIENSAIDTIAVFAPWLGPIPSAYLVGRACINYLHWHWSIAWIAAIAVESIGVVSVVLSLRLYEWNETKNKTDPAAPFKLSLLLVATYFLVTIGLTVLLDVFPELARFSPAIFPLLAAVGAVNIAVKNGQQRREAVKLESKKSKPTNVLKETRKPETKETPKRLSGTKLLVSDIHQRNPDMTHQEIADWLSENHEINITRQAVGKHVRSLNGVSK